MEIEKINKEEPLITEAKKYNSAENFVKAQEIPTLQKAKEMNFNDIKNISQKIEENNFGGVDISFPVSDNSQLFRISFNKNKEKIAIGFNYNYEGEMINNEVGHLIKSKE